MCAVVQSPVPQTCPDSTPRPWLPLGGSPNHFVSLSVGRMLAMTHTLLGKVGGIWKLPAGPSGFY